MSTLVRLSDHGPSTLRCFPCAYCDAWLTSNHMEAHIDLDHPFIDCTMTEENGTWLCCPADYEPDSEVFGTGANPHDAEQAFRQAYAKKTGSTPRVFLVSRETDERGCECEYTDVDRADTRGCPVHDGVFNGASPRADSNAGARLEPSPRPRIFTEDTCPF